VATTTSPAATRSVSPAIESKGVCVSVGAQCRATPVVGCAQATMRRPPGGIAKSGMITDPETAIGRPPGSSER